MATIDGRPGDLDFGREVYLKFWRWDAASSTWNLNSRTDRPHGAHRVVAMEFIPSNPDASPYLVTCGEDRNVKTWRIRSIKSKAGKEGKPSCRFMLKKKGNIMVNNRILGMPFNVWISFEDAFKCSLLFRWIVDSRQL